jgi:hypothetical protein
MSVGGMMDTREQRNQARTTALYRRDLPGGGFVAIDVCGSSPHDVSEPVAEAGDASRSDHEVPRTRIYVERRSDQTRRSGHEPPIIAEVMGEVSPSEAGELYRMAADNVALARALLAWQSRRLAESTSDSQ